MRLAGLEVLDDQVVELLLAGGHWVAVRVSAVRGRVIAAARLGGGWESAPRGTASQLPVEIEFAVPLDAEFRRRAHEQHTRMGDERRRGRPHGYRA